MAKGRYKHGRVGVRRPAGSLSSITRQQLDDIKAEAFRKGWRDGRKAGIQECRQIVEGSTRIKDARSKLQAYT